MQSLPNRVPAVALAALSLAALSLAVACGAPRTDPALETVVVALENAPIHLDPRLGTDQASSRVFEAALEGLLTKDTQGNLQPALATRWEILEDGLRYRFHLQPDVRFHDDREFTASDVVWTFQSLLDGSVVSPKAGALVQIERVEAVDAHTVDFVLSEPYGALLPNLTSYLGIVPDGMTPDEMNRQPIGTGPFRVVARSPDRVELAAFDGYRQGRPSIDRVVLREVPDATVRALELRKGSVDLVINGLAPDEIVRFRDRDGFRVVESPGSNYTYLGLHLEDPALRDVRVRRAIALALDRQKIVDTIWHGLGLVTETMIPPGHWARHDGLEPIPHDPEAARRLLDEAGFPDPAGEAPRLHLTYKTSTDETALLQAQIIQAMLAAVGIEVEIRSYEFATFYSDIKQGDFQLFSLTWTGIIDPDIYSLVLHSERMPPDGSNRGRYSNPEFDRLIDAGARAVRPEDRRPYYLEAQEIFARELPYVSLFTKVNVAVIRDDLVGYDNYPSGELYALRRLARRGDG